MFSLKCLTKKFNKQTLNEVKPAPLSETVDHTLTTLSSTTDITPSTGIITSSSSSSTSSASSNAPPTFPPSPSTSSTASSVIPEDPVHIQCFTKQPSDSSSSSSSSAVTSAGNSANGSSFPSPSPSATLSTSNLSPLSSASSDSEEEDEEAGYRRLPSLRIKAHPHSPRKARLPSTQLKIERISSAEKRKYSQFKGSTGSSSPSSSDDEIKEAFETSTTSSSRHQWSRTPPAHLSARAWAQSVPSPSGTPGEQQQQQQALNSSWSIGQFEACTSRPLKVVPVGGQNKHKFFAQMSTRYSSERPFLDFNKMQHSKRVVMVRRPMVIRNHSKVHSIQRPPSLCPHVSLDISQNSFQPVLTQT